MNRALYAAPVLVALLAAGCTSSSKGTADETSAPSASSNAPASSAASSPATSPAVSSPAASAASSSPVASTVSPSASASKSPAVSPTPVATAAAASTFAGIVNQSTATLGTVDKTLSTLDSSSGPAVAKVTFPLAGTFAAANNKLSGIVWPAEAAANVRGVIVTFQAIITDLEGVAGSQTFSFAAFQPKFDADVASATKELALVKSELGG